jgi:hypothetical protein
MSNVPTNRNRNHGQINVNSTSALPRFPRFRRAGLIGLGFKWQHFSGWSGRIQLEIIRKLRMTIPLRFVTRPSRFSGAWVAKGDAIAQRQFIHTIFGIAA